MPSVTMCDNSHEVKVWRRILTLLGMAMDVSKERSEFMKKPFSRHVKKIRKWNKLI